jgi:hypothetical protein
LRIAGLTSPAHEEAKEVAQMNTNTITMAAKIPSGAGTGMPICGHLPTSAQAQTSFVGVDPTSVVRDRQAAIKGDMGLAYALGTIAWRPPSS